MHHRTYHIFTTTTILTVTPPHATTITQCKWNMWASGWNEKHHQRKLQWMMITKCASEVFVPADGWKTTTSASCSRCWPPHVPVEYFHLLMEGKHHQCKVQRSGQHPGKLEQDPGTTCNYNYHHHYWPDQDQHRSRWSAQCSNQCNLCKGTPFTL